MSSGTFMSHTCILYKLLKFEFPIWIFYIKSTILEFGGSSFELKATQG